MLRLSIVLMLAVVTLSSAQSLGNHDYSFRVNVELVQLPVSVLDKHGFPVRGLREREFAVYEDKVLQDITLFKQEDIPLSVGLVVDTSSSMKQLIATRRDKSVCASGERSDVLAR